jgi:hypothetical protein
MQDLGLDCILDPAIPALAHLRSLELTFLGMEYFPVSLASALKCLTNLNLADNFYERIPTAISQITALRILDLSSIPWLQLRHIDVDYVNTLAALPELQMLELRKTQVLLRSLVSFGEESWSGVSFNIFKVIRKRLPHLKVQCRNSMEAWSFPSERDGFKEILCKTLEPGM